MYKLCKTEQSAVRQRELEKKLVELMSLRRYEEISVSDFCVFAEIPRKAFYRYFSSKDGALYAVLDHTIMDYDFFHMPVVPDKVVDMQQELERFFQFWKNQKPLLDSLANSGLSGILVERSIGNVAESVKNIQTQEDGKTRQHLVQFSVCGLMCMVVNWHAEGYGESVQEMSGIAARLLTQPLLALK